MPYAIDYSNIYTVCDGVGSLYGAPGIVLSFSALSLLGWMPTDRRRIKKNVCALQSREAGSLGVPLVPTDQSSYATCRCIECLEAQVSRSEVELFVVEGIVGNMHFAIAASQRAVRVEYDCGVVINTGGPSFEN